MNTTPDSHAPSDAFLWTLVTLHIVLWCGLPALLTWWVVPQVRTLFNDFGVELPASAIWVIAFTDWMANYWYILLPIIALLVAGADLLMFSMTRSVWIRSLWMGMGCLLPLLANGTAFAIIRQVFADIRQQMGGSP